MSDFKAKMHQIHFLLGLRLRPRGAPPQTPLGELAVPPDPCLYLRGLLLRGWRETGEREEKVKGKEGDRWREGFGPPKNFGVAPPMDGLKSD